MSYRFFKQLFLWATFRSSKRYWEKRYGMGLTSGAGSLGALAEFKASFLNDFVRSHDIVSVIEFGCGDGNQLSLAQYPLYLGLDVSQHAIDLCQGRFAGDPKKSFLWYDPAYATNLGSFVQADLALSIDVLYHLVEDDVYWKYLQHLFSTSRRYVIIYSTDDERRQSLPHVRHRKFSSDVQEHFPHFQLKETVANRFPNQSPCSFFVYGHANT